MVSGHANIILSADDDDNELLSSRRVLTPLKGIPNSNNRGLQGKEDVFICFFQYKTLSLYRVEDR